MASASSRPSSAASRDMPQIRASDATSMSCPNTDAASTILRAPSVSRVKRRSRSARTPTGAIVDSVRVRAPRSTPASSSSISRSSSRRNSGLPRVTSFKAELNSIERAERLGRSGRAQEGSHLVIIEARQREPDALCRSSEMLDELPLVGRRCRRREASRPGPCRRAPDGEQCVAGDAASAGRPSEHPRRSGPAAARRAAAASSRPLRTAGTASRRHSGRRRVRVRRGPRRGGPARRGARRGLRRGSLR